MKPAELDYESKKSTPKVTAFQRFVSVTRAAIYLGIAIGLCMCFWLIINFNGDSDPVVPWKGAVCAVAFAPLPCLFAWTGISAIRKASRGE